MDLSSRETCDLLGLRKPLAMRRGHVGRNRVFRIRGRSGCVPINIGIHVEKESSTDGAPKTPEPYPHAFWPKSNNGWAHSENFHLPMWSPWVQKLYSCMITNDGTL